MKKTGSSFRLPSELPKVPQNRSGVYWFGLAFPRPHELGLKKEMSWEEKSTVAALMLGIVNRYASVYNRGELTGAMKDQRGAHFGRRYSIQASQLLSKDPLSFLREPLEGYGPDELISFYEALNHVAVSLPPVYVGLAYDSSFFERLNQHIDGRSNLLAKLDDANLVWQDLYFKCIPMTGLAKQDYRLLEKTLQALYSPVFSIN